MYGHQKTIYAQNTDYAFESYLVVYKFDFSDIKADHRLIWTTGKKKERKKENFKKINVSFFHIDFK